MLLLSVGAAPLDKAAQKQAAAPPGIAGEDLVHRGDRLDVARLAVVGVDEHQLHPGTIASPQGIDGKPDGIAVLGSLAVSDFAMPGGVFMIQCGRFWLGHAERVAHATCWRNGLSIRW